VSRFSTGVARAVVLISFGASLLVTTGSAVFAADQVPYDDPASSGVITLCDADLNSITEGSISDQPFVWRGVGSQAAPAPYNDVTRRANLVAYQPRKGVSPGLWTGEPLTAASTYTSADHPIAQATVIDFPLKVFLSRYPAEWDGFVQLRMYYTASEAPVSVDYAATNIQVSGDRWRVVGPSGTAPCDAGDAVSPETLLPNFEKSAKAVEARLARTADKSTASSTAAPTRSASRSPESLPSSTVTLAGDDSSDSSRWPLIVFLLIVTALAVAALFAWRRRHRQRRGRHGRHRH
jgi:MYXO-CTERM domain-containing protein